MIETSPAHDPLLVQPHFETGSEHNNPVTDAAGGAIDYPPPPVCLEPRET